MHFLSLRWIERENSPLLARTLCHLCQCVGLVCVCMWLCCGSVLVAPALNPHVG